MAADRLSSHWQRIRRHPAFQAAVVYAGASWVLVQVADIFFPALGISEAAIGWVGIVLALGFVIVIPVVWRLAGREDEGEEPRAGVGLEGEVEAAEPPSKGRARRRLAYVAAVGLLVLGGLIWWISPRLLAGRVAPGAEVIAVLPFRTSGTGVELLGEGMVDLLTTNLDGVGGIRAVDPRTVLHHWRRRTESGAVDSAGALAVARDVDAGAVLIGSAVAAGREVRLGARLRSVEGRELAVVGVDGPADSVLALVDSLSLRLLRAIWRSRAPLPDLRVSAITTGSVDAIRAYLRGEQYYRRSQWDSARAAFVEAVRSDSTFALAHFKLALTYGWTVGHGSAEARGHSDIALRHSDRLPTREESLVRAHELFEEARFESLDTMRAYVDRYPDDAEGWYLLGDVRFHATPLLDAVPEDLFEPFDRVLDLDPSFAPAIIHPIELSLGMADSARYFDYLERLENVGSAETSAPYRAAGTILWGPPDSAYAVAVRLWREQPRLLAHVTMATYQSPSTSPETILRGVPEMAERIQDDPGLTQALLQLRGALLISLGRLAEAGALIDSITTDRPGDAAMISLLPALVGMAPPEFADLGLRFMEGLPRRNPDRAEPRWLSNYFQLLYALSRGRAAEARGRIDSLRTLDVGSSAEERRGLVDAAEGWLSLLEGDTTRALSRIETGLQAAGYGGQTLFLGTATRFQWAATLAARPETRAEGIRRLEMMQRRDQLFYPLYEFVRAQALEAADSTEAAARAYGRVLELWEDADPYFQPRADAARRAIRRLTDEADRSAS